jgi:Ca2+-binding EF-hand superfamily protein
VQWFKAIDRDGNGRLDAAELQRALGLGNLHFSLQLTSHMIRCGRR